jgi:Sulfotransferase domain
MLPNFLIIGAARSGTTTLYNHLKDHPDVYLPANKRPEPHFFLKATEYAQGLAYYEQRFFSAWRNQRAIGEASTSYLFGTDVPKRIRGSLRDVKLVCILRDPVERAFSSYWHTIKSGLETLSFDEAILREAERKDGMTGTAMGEIAPFAYAERGFYHRQLSGWLSEFPRSQMKIVIFDDFVADPNKVLREIAGFIEVSPDDLPKRAVEVENRSVPDETRMLSATRRRLLDEFREDVVALGQLLDRDLSHWLKP